MIEERYLSATSTKPQLADTRTSGQIIRATIQDLHQQGQVATREQGGHNDWVDAARQEAAAWVVSQGLSDACNVRV